MLQIIQKHRSYEQAMPEALAKTNWIRSHIEVRNADSAKEADAGGA
ncbi:MAG: hypothetical protein DVB28_000446 [Verrucomicrobia bacterium]|nr:MAG: hypothetical protein DVB28_000446 [Verrucomicrobiota bacterium]